MRSKPLPGILTMAVALGSLAALGGWTVLGLSVWQGLASYALVGTIATLLLAWCHGRCLDRAAAAGDARTGQRA